MVDLEHRWRTAFRDPDSKFEGEPPWSGAAMPVRADPPVPRSWHGWYAHSMEARSTPLAIEAPIRRRWSRFVYLAAVTACLLVGLDFLAGQIFWYTAQGVIGETSYSLSPTEVGVVARIGVTPGERVRKGQVLVSFSSPALHQSLAQAQANIAAIESNLQNQAKASRGMEGSLRAELSGLSGEYQALRQDYESQQSMIESTAALAAQGVLNFSDVDQLRERQLQLKAQIAAVYAKMLADRAQLRQLAKAGRPSASGALDRRLASLQRLREGLALQMRSLELRAPIEGIVAQLPVTRGQTVRPGEAAVVIVPPGNQRTLFYFPPAARSRLSAHQRLVATTPDGTRIAMHITRIYPSTQDLPETLQRPVNDRGPAIVAVAQPLRPRDVEELAAGTPVTARVPRWHAIRLPYEWWHKLRGVFAGRVV